MRLPSVGAVAVAAGVGAEVRVSYESVLIVGVGGFVGANVRYLLGLWLTERLGAGLPWATLLINVTGSLLIGLFLVLATERIDLDPRWRLLFVTGFLGAYTTFSTFSWETLTLVEAGDYLPAALYVGGSVGAGFVAVVLGVWLARQG